jgi:PST family polysaccharide transporter
LSGHGIKRAVTWSAVENGGLALLSFATLIVFARYLSPAEFGLFSMVLAIVEIGSMLTTSFFHDALIQRKEVDERHYDSAFWVSVGASVLFVVLCWASADAFTRLSGASEGGRVLVLTALAVPAATLSATAMARLRREFNLRPLAMRSLIGRLFGGVVGIALVILGAGIWGMVAQQVLVPLAGSLMLWATLRMRYRLRVDRTRLMELARFGLPATLSLFLTYAVKRLFVILAGIYIGTEAAGHFNLGFRVVEVLWSLCWNAIVQVALPLLSRRQGDAEQVRRAFTAAGELTSLGVFLIFGLIAVLAREIVAILFGPAWTAAAPYVGAMALVVLLQGPRLLITSQLTAAGRPGLNAAPGVLEIAFVVAAFPLLQPDSLALAVLLWAMRELAGTALASALLQRQGVLSLPNQWGPALPAAAGVLSMLVGCALARAWLIPASWGDWPSLLLLGSLACAFYALGVAAIDRRMFGRSFARVGWQSIKPG